MYIDDLKKKFDDKETSKQNPEYVKAKSKLRSKKGNVKKVGYKEIQKIKSTIRVNFKLYYIRYVDYWLIGILGSKKDVTNVRENIENFLKNKLDLELSVDKKKLFMRIKKKHDF